MRPEFLNKLAGQSWGILETIQQFSFMNETADELQTTTRRAVVAVPTGWWCISTLSAEGGVMLYGLIRLSIRTRNIPGGDGGGDGGIERRSPECNDVNLGILFFFLPPCSLCATVGGSFLYTLRMEATAPRV
jgi:hypothetical protein